MGKFTDDKFKAPAKALQDKIDKLVTWYENFKPEGGKVIEVECTDKELSSFATLSNDGKRWYRGRELVPIKTKTPSLKKYQAEHQAKIQ